MSNQQKTRKTRPAAANPGEQARSSLRPGPFQRILDEDARWFAAHPDAKERRRYSVEGEGELFGIPERSPIFIQRPVIRGKVVKTAMLFPSHDPPIGIISTIDLATGSARLELFDFVQEEPHPAGEARGMQN